jgi:putative tryptophan/tyrosine transport system substrate-binding protein
VTGVTVISNELEKDGKRLDFLCQLVPDATIVGYLAGPPDNRLTNEELMNGLRAAARVIGRQLVVVETPDATGFEAAFATLAKNRAPALVVGGFPLFSHQRDKLLPFAARYKIPTIYQSRDFVFDGGLMSYGGNYDDAFRLAGNLSDRYSKAPSRPIFRCSRPPNSSWSSTSKPPKRSAFKSHHSCSPLPTR